ncbi:unnamed protein product [Medioppia subpectinata]|uniref:histone acetyltransferase n=1 Tax=Medioppia subpectinata TaxID=1979941 RepID=A0A7R9KRU1_9ACAR|nr:unnamed protein product [Medioppia subpectinata]CAG2107443.1 unnamed protein product [Medioppia subpectinata]
MYNAVNGARRAFDYMKVMTTKTAKTDNSGPVVLDPHKRLLIRNQLLLILHSKTCHDHSCPKANCSTMKSVLQHVHTCTAVNSCPIAHCMSTRQIGSHWQNCVRTDMTCEVCSPYKERIASLRKAAIAQQSAGTAAEGTKHWHLWITPDVRNRMVEKLVSALISNSNGHDLEDMTVKHMFDYVYGIEQEIYKSAESLVQYHHLFWRKIYIVESYAKRLRQSDGSVSGVTQGFDCLVLESVLEADNDFKAIVLN